MSVDTVNREKFMPFEILTLHDTTWQIDATVTKKVEAEEVANQMLSEPGVTGVRIVLDHVLIAKSIDQLEDEDIIFEKLKEAGQEKIFINDIDEAPDCSIAKDLLLTPSRKVINKLFRRYLDKNNITAIEALHNSKELKRVMDADALVPSAIAKVSKLQADPDLGNANERRDKLFEFVQAITEDAKKAEDKSLPKIDSTNFDQSVATIDGISQGDDFEHLLNTAITKQLIDIRDWWGKLVQSIELGEAAQDSRGLAAIDRFIADILMNNSVIQDLLGDQTDLGSAIIKMLDLSSGSLELGKIEDMQSGSIEETKAKLNRLLGSADLLESSQILTERVSQQIGGSAALSKTGEEGERERFDAILDRLVISDGVKGGGELARAILERQTRIINKGGLTGLKEAVTTLVSRLSSPARKIAFLLSLSESKKGIEQLREHIAAQIDHLFLEPTSLNSMVVTNLPPNQKMQQVTASFHQIERSDLEADKKQQIMTKLDDLLFTYIEESKIIEKIDNAQRPMHLRALMLVGMCQEEMLPKGRASEIPRKILAAHIKDPDFSNQLVAQVEDADEKDRVVNRFQAQLKRAQINV
jgi:flagellar biosynthesis regulator FlaF